MEEQHPLPPSSSSSASHHHSHHPHHHHHHHHHHYYYYNHNHHQHHQHYEGTGGTGAGGNGKAPLAPQRNPKHDPRNGGSGGSFGAAPQVSQETTRRRTGYGELNGSVGERECSLKGLNATGDIPGPVSRVTNGSQAPGDATLTMKPTAKGGPFGKPGLKAKSFLPKAVTDKKSEEKPETVPIPNGVVTNASCYITNGYAGKGADNDGSGSESGYTTPKKRKGRHNSESLEKTDPESEGGDSGDTKAGSCIEGLKPAWKCEAGAMGMGRKPGMLEPPRKNSDAKVGLVGKKFEERLKGKPALASKEDSWTLFKPPPVFPVDNSSAKIVPKISYASKVKENLNKSASAQNPLSSSSSSSSSSLCLSSATDAPLPAPNRLSQVPMSAMKSVTSANFSNGVSCPAGAQPLLVPASGAIVFAPSESATPDEPKPSLLIYPSNMQALLLDRPEPPTAFQGHLQQNLGDIFQNKWGLSFINEPSAGPEKPAEGRPVEGRAAEGRPTVPNPPPNAPPAFPKAYELDKRTCPPPLLNSLLKLGTPSDGGGGSFFLDSHPPGVPRHAEVGGPGGPFVFLAKDCHAENRLASPTNNVLASAKEQRYPRGLERKESWGDFDLRAAVLYHTQEMESLCNLQKQDPKRIITYDEAMDRPNQ